MKVVIIDYQAGNTQSVAFALERLGITPTLSGNADEITAADKVIFPGVGEASSTMKYLRKKKLDQLITGLKQPVLGVCLGMQLMCRYSEEGDAEGLNIFPLDVKHFTGNIKVPHMGWNSLDKTSQWLKNIEQGSYCYFVHSYFVPVSEYTAAVTNYSGEFSAALQKDNFYAVQFHPEKSSDTGSKILKTFLEL
ncbi:MAG: imidazole glycerol phosphate synthase subunit HisH [Candidatus Cyclobacteriaceae bacterium M2_1C_046]